MAFCYCSKRLRLKRLSLLEAEPTRNPWVVGNYEHLGPCLLKNYRIRMVQYDGSSFDQRPQDGETMQNTTPILLQREIARVPLLLIVLDHVLLVGTDARHPVSPFFLINAIRRPA